MSEYNQNLTIPAQNDFTIRFSVTNNTTGSPIPIGDIVGASWAMTPLEEEVTPLISKDLTTGGITVPEDGIVLVALDASDTDGLSGEFSHELRLKDSGGTRTASRGKLTIKYQIAVNPI